MTQESARERYQWELAGFERVFGHLPGAREQLDRFVGLLELPRFQAWVQKVFAGDYSSPLGQYVKMGKELDEVSHRLPAHYGLRGPWGHGGWVQTLIRLIPGNSVVRSHYGDLVLGLLACLLELEHTGDFDKEAIWKMYGLLDRVLFGGKEFARVVQVPRVTADYYRGLRKTKGLLWTGAVSDAMLVMLEILGKERYGEDFKKIWAVLLGSVDLLIVASAYRNGRRRCIYDDAYDAVETVIRLFHYPGRFLDLPMPKREGEPYRGCAEIVKFADEPPPGAGGGS